jgi:hypothetical protein
MNVHFYQCYTTETLRPECPDSNSYGVHMGKARKKGCQPLKGWQPWSLTINRRLF